MADETVQANGRDVATKGTGHVGAQTQDDILKIHGKETPFFNYAKTKDALVSSATRTFYKEFPIWTATGKLLPSIEAPSSPSGPGKKSGTYCDKIEATDWSHDVIVEGNGVVRWHDPTNQNDANTIGKVVTEVEFEAMLKKFLDDLAAAAAAALKKPGAGGDGPKTGRAAKTDGQKSGFKKVKDGDGSQDDVPCDLESVEIVCSHGNREMDETRTLMVVPGNASDTITCTAEVNAPCDKHVAWAIGGYYTTTAQGTTTTFGATAWGQMASGLSAILTLLGITPHVYEVTATACAGEENGEKYIVKAYPGFELSYTVEVDALKRALVLVEKAFAEVFHKQIEIQLLVGSGVAKAQWKESEEKWQAYPKLSVELGFDPLVGAIITFPIPLPPPFAVVNAALEKLGVGGIELNVKLSGGIAVAGSIGINVGSPEPSEGEITITGKIGIAFVPELTLGHDAVTVSASIGAEAGLEGKFSLVPQPQLLAELTLYVGKVQGGYAIEVSLGKIDWDLPLVGKLKTRVGTSFKGQVTLFEGAKWPIVDKTPIWPSS